MGCDTQATSSRREVSTATSRERAAARSWPATESSWATLASSAEAIGAMVVTSPRPRARAVWARRRADRETSRPSQAAMSTATGIAAARVSAITVLS